MTKSLLSNAQADIKLRDETLLQLESVLQRTTNRYAKMIEDDRQRLVTNVSIGIQEIPITFDFSQQVDFVRHGSMARCTISEGQKPNLSTFIRADPTS